MSKINVLSFEVANLIAAGEVVERPSSVLKELIENSIDSGASVIEAEIKKGGVALIRVTDNGCGMEKEDIPLSLKRHATSKIKNREDLDSIITLGFRGEALAAISSVSEMTIISKTKDAPSATMLTASAGNVVDISEVGAANGTTVVVENLFGNVPARRKFLKRDATEAANVTALVEKIALSHPEISISLRIDGDQRFKTSGDGDLLNTVRAIFGADFSSKLIKAEGIASGVKVSGFIGRSDNVRKNRNMQNFFINGRYVKSLTAIAAIEKAYTSYIAPEAFPTCILFIEMHPGEVDVNVHPAKLEVKFTDEKQVFEAIYYTVKSALEKYEYRPEIELGNTRNTAKNVIGSYVPLDEKRTVRQIRMNESDPHTSQGRISQEEKKTYKEERALDMHSYSPPAPSYSHTVPQSERMTPKNSVELLARYHRVNNLGVSNSVPEPEKTEMNYTENVIVETVPEYKIIGEAFDCYVLVQTEDSMLIIDKHAAHERIIFEELKEKIKAENRICSQSLLLPVTIILTPEEYCAVCDYSSDLKAVGFDFTVNEKSADLLEIPSAISFSDAEDLFIKMVDELVEGRGDPHTTDQIRNEKSLYQIACKAAIKGGRIYDRTIIEWIVRKVLMLPDITVCPHGRPIAYKLTKSELDRQFERIK